VLISLLMAAPLFVIHAQSGTTTSQPSNYFRGINLFGGWQGGYGGTDTFASSADLDYYHSKGLNWFRVPLRWEALQPALNAPLDATYLGKMDALVTAASARGQHISFTLINQGTYNGNNLGTSQVPYSAFADVWSRLATHYLGNSTIYAHDLMNEPWHTVSWPTASQAAINAIRAIDPTTPIISQPLDNQPFRYDNSFVGYTGGNIWYAAHVYGDKNCAPADPSGWGQYATDYTSDCGSPDVMVNRVTPFVNWCKNTGNVCVVSEYGIPGSWTSGNANGVSWGTPRPDQTQWNTMLDHLLTYLDTNHISGNYWEAGAYGDINSASPSNGVDAPQMSILTAHPSVTPALPPTVTVVPPTTTPKLTPVTLPAGYTFADDFNAPFNSAAYNTCYRWACAGGWNNELERYVPEQVTTHDGVLDLRADKRDVTAHNIVYHYVSGMVTTADKFSFLYGVTEARFKVPAGKGYWPAIWMLAQNGQSTTELDLIENIGDNDIHSGMHWLDASNNHKHQGTTLTVPNLSADWHTISVNWQPSSFALDGTEYYRETDPTHIPSTPMYLLANLAIGGNWPGNPDGSTVFPADFLLDYIHVTANTSLIPTVTPTAVPPTAVPTNTPIPPTATPVPPTPTNTPVPPTPTVTPTVPTATPVPTNTPVPPSPTPTNTPSPTTTPIPTANPLPLPVTGCTTWAVPTSAGYTETLTICKS